jgi:Holliday junction resolvase-like predicted endonuclease
MDVKSPMPIPRNVWNKSLGKLLENLIHDFLNKMGVPNLVRVRVSKGDADIVIIDKLRNVISIIEIKNLSGNYQLEPDKVDELNDKYRRIEDWIKREFGCYKIQRIAVVSHLKCNKVLRKQLRKAHKIKIVETGIQVIPSRFRSKLPLLEDSILNGDTTHRAFSEDCLERLVRILDSKLYPLVVPNEWDKKRMFDGLSSKMAFKDAINHIKSMGFAHLLESKEGSIVGDIRDNGGDEVAIESPYSVQIGLGPPNQPSNQASMGLTSSDTSLPHHSVQLLPVSLTGPPTVEVVSMKGVKRQNWVK